MKSVFDTIVITAADDAQATCFRLQAQAFEACGYDRTFTVEMIPFSRLPDLVLPDQALAEKVVGELKGL